MEKTKYLYGAAIQGIQSFIFQTNVLQEIVGASELVEQICTEQFEEALGKSLTEDENLVLAAAGNIKYIFTNEDDCKKMALNFPRKISKFAPGITISQAVIKFENNFSDAVNKLEKSLRTQRNIPTRPLNLGQIGIARSRNTGLPAVTVKGDEFIDLATSRKRELGERTTRKLCEINFGKKCINRELALNIEEITGKNDWIAVIHIDGNSLGQVVQKIGTDEKKFRQFSQNLDRATKEAAVAAFEAVADQFINAKIIPMRPIVLSGDDHTIICRADIALDYVEAFLKAFEEKTQEHLSAILKESSFAFDHLSSCAGIAYIKSSYPFYYGYSLSEELCKEAKKDAKAGLDLSSELPKSCVMFHKVQDSFTEKYSEIAKRELMTKDEISFQFGPYYLKEKDSKWSIARLRKNAIDELSGTENESIKSHLRQWLTLLHESQGMAEQKIKRLKQQKLTKIVFIENLVHLEKKVTPVYDMLVINTIMNQNTKEAIDANH